MCLILFAYRSHPLYELVVAANRDEFFSRPTAAMDFWEEPSEILAGRDLVAGGTWLGVTRQGRFAAITNYRDPQQIKLDAPSRGLLVSEFLDGALDARSYLADLEGRAHQYNGFSLVLADAAGLFVYSNRGSTEVLTLQPGVYGLSNHLLDTGWPKVQRGRRLFAELLRTGKEPNPEQLLALLMDKEVPADEDLPNTGVGLELERLLGPIFIRVPNYGTRSSSVLLLRAGDGGLVVETTHAPGESETSTRRFAI